MMEVKGQDSKVSGPISVTEVGISMEEREVQ